MSAVSASEHAKALRRIEELEVLLKKQEHISDEVNRRMGELNKRVFDEQEVYYTEKISDLKSKIEYIENENRELHHALFSKNFTLEEYKNDNEKLNRSYIILNRELDRVTNQTIALDFTINSYQIDVLSFEDKIYKLNNKNTKNNLIKQNLPLSIPSDVLNIINDYSDDKYENIYKSVVKDIPFAADYFLTLKYRHILDVPFWNKTNVFHFKEVRSQISKGLEIFKRYNYNFRKYQIF